jgi:hypothetical protein
MADFIETVDKMFEADQRFGIPIGGMFGIVTVGESVSTLKANLSVWAFPCSLCLKQLYTG